MKKENSGGLNKFYSVTTRKFCAGVGVDNYGFIVASETAPCFQWAAKRRIKFEDFKNFLKRKNDLINIQIVRSIDG
jgi:hypothetical protein